MDKDTAERMADALERIADTLEKLAYKDYALSEIVINLDTIDKTLGDIRRRIPI